MALHHVSKWWSAWKLKTIPLTRDMLSASHTLSAIFISCENVTGTQDLLGTCLTMPETQKGRDKDNSAVTQRELRWESGEH